MKRCDVTLEFVSYWQPGSGLGMEAAADSAVVRDEVGLPFLPGRTLKGLLRDACELAGVEPKRLVDWFGSAIPDVDQDKHPEPGLERARYTTKPGALRFESARLPPAWIEWARTHAGPEAEEVRAALFRFIASTSIDARGVAKDETLRVMEVVVPMTLTAEVTGPDSDEWIEDLKKGAPLLRAIGSRRHRGYGRVRCEVK